jgi:hypothetical protein
MDRLDPKHAILNSASVKDAEANVKSEEKLEN